MTFPRYPSYKDSGVDSLGAVPTHWETALLKRYVTVRSGEMIAATEETESGFPIIGGNGVRGYTSRSNAPANTLVVGRVGARCGCVHYITEDFWASEHAFRVIERRPFSRRYFFHLLSALNLNQFAIKTAQPLLNTDIFETRWVAIPPIQEQTLIATFLDSETAKIDALIAEQQRLIELLNEKRRAVICHAVTQGLNPDAPMKPSGVEWLGALPAHWRVTKMKWVADMQSGHTPDKKVPAYWEGGDIPWISLNDTGFLKDHDYITHTANYITQLGIDNSSARLLPARAVVFSRDATIGRCAITTRPMAVSQHFIAWICGVEVLPEFLLLRLRSMTQELDRLTTGATLKTIGMPDVRTLVTPLPPVEEQHEIVAAVADMTTANDELVERAQEVIALLEERRSALISAAVTGQIDVGAHSRVEAA